MMACYPLVSLMTCSICLVTQALLADGQMVSLIPLPPLSNLHDSPSTCHKLDLPDD